MPRVEFLDCGEIRMGSPFNICGGIRLDLDWAPNIPIGGYQDIWAASPDGRFIALVVWHTPGNVPGFVVYTIDNVERTVAHSQPQSGCCERIWWDGGFRWLP
jgi:hypothetical protein